MSSVSGVVLCTSCAEEEVCDEGGAALAEDICALFEKINVWLKDRGNFALVQVEKQFGGGKHPQMFVAGGGFNYFPEDDFAAFVIALPWRYPHEVVLIIQPEDGATRVFRPDYQPV